MGRRAGIPWGDRRPPPPSPEGAAKTWWKRYFWAIMNTSFLNCVEHDRHRILRKSGVTHCYWIHPMIVWSVTRKNEQYIEKKINKILVYRFLGTLFLKAKWSSNTCPTSWERRNLCLHYKMLCTIRETTSLSNLFQPLDLRQNGLAMMAILIYGYIWDSLAKKWLLLLNFG